jgi:hypothetical protein
MQRTAGHIPGDLRGRWEGDTLVIDTINFKRETSLPVPTCTFSRNSPAPTRRRSSTSTLSTIRAYGRGPWIVVIPMRRSDQPIYEYACHEGNHAMAGILAGAPAAEKAAEAKNTSK